MKKLSNGICTLTIYYVFPIPWKCTGTVQLEGVFRTFSLLIKYFPPIHRKCPAALLTDS